jgi:Kdo2-lipid IVA lauroyltransferase/acyltransferase
MARLALGLLRLLARLPLRWYHAIGAGLGWIVYWSSARYASRLRDNLRASKVWTDEADYQRILRSAIAETGRQGMEILPLWFRPQSRVTPLVRACVGEQAVLDAYAQGRGVVLLTPHLGCFEISAIYAAEHFPITVLYRTPRIAWLETLIVAGRGRGQEKLAPASLKGVRLLLKALRDKEAIGVLPDQVPSAGEGEWVEFFERPAYTMTLIGRLCETLDPAVFVAAARRLPHGRGYEIEVEPVVGGVSGADGIRRMNAAIEHLVRKHPEQYLWSYNRYKQPRGAPPPPAAA